MLQQHIAAALHNSSRRYLYPKTHILSKEPFKEPSKETYNLYMLQQQIAEAIYKTTTAAAGICTIYMKFYQKSPAIYILPTASTIPQPQPQVTRKLP